MNGYKFSTELHVAGTSRFQIYNESGRLAATAGLPADAAEIARRWNAHEDLIGACTAARHQCFAVLGLVKDQEHRKLIERAIGLADSAIAKAVAP